MATSTVIHPAVASTVGEGVLSRIIEQFRHARIRATEREIARLIEAKGGRLTDDLERQIERTLI